jgi:SAM-dependent methyltransferase
MICPICGREVKKLKPDRHLNYFFQCPNCSGYFAKEKPEIVYSENYFVQEPESVKNNGFFSILLNFFLWLRFKKISKFLISKNSQVLDYGCGNGKLVSYLRKKGILVDGYDPSPAAVALAKKSGLPVFGEVPSKQYDLIMFWHSLEHTDAPLLDFKKLLPRLSPKGKVLIAVPNGDSWEAKSFGRTWFCYDWPYHRIHFNLRSINALLNQGGLRLVSADFLNPEYTFSSLAQTFLNLFLPKNALYGMVAQRRSALNQARLAGLTLVSLALLLIFSPLLAVFLLLALIFRKTAAFIVVAERTS